MRLLVALICGIASQYASGVMQQVVHNRQAMHQLPAVLPAVDGFIAVADCGRIGEVWRVNGEMMLASDCSSDAATTAWMSRNNILAEVDYETARRWHTVGRGIDICIGDVNRVDKMRMRKAS